MALRNYITGAIVPDKVTKTNPITGQTTTSPSRPPLPSYIGGTPTRPVDTSGDANRRILRGLGLDLDTVLTPRGKRKKSANLRGGDTAELANLLGE